MPSIATRLSKISMPPSKGEDFNVWLKHQETLLESNLRQDDIVIYASLTHTFMHMVLVPASLLRSPDIDDLMSWNCNASSSWGISYDFSEPPSVYVSPPLSHTGSKTIDQGEQLVFTRFFEGRLGDHHYIEILQKLVHASDLHFITERNAYCRLDKHGDIEDVIRIIELEETASSRAGTVVTITRDTLDDYMVLTDSTAVLTFDFIRVGPGGFGGWRQERKEDVVTANSLSYRLAVQEEASIGHDRIEQGCCARNRRSCAYKKLVSVLW